MAGANPCQTLRVFSSAVSKYSISKWPFSSPLTRHQQHLEAFFNIVAMRLWSELVRMDESETVSSKQAPEKAFRVKENLELPQIALIKQYMLWEGWIFLLCSLKSASKCSGIVIRGVAHQIWRISVSILTLIFSAINQRVQEVTLL